MCNNITTKSNYFAFLLRALCFTSLFICETSCFSPVGLEECGKSRACWAFPPECDLSDNCYGIMRWRFENKKLHVELQAKPIVGPSEAQWMAIAFSDDLQMGNDTVLECVFGLDGNQTANAFISYNQFTQNIRLRGASTAMIKNKDFLQTEGKLGCSFTADYNTKLGAEERKRVLKLDSPVWWHVLFAQGPADKSAQKQFHLLVQKSDQLVHICENCDDKFVVIER